MCSSLPFSCLFFYLNFGVWHSMLSVYISTFAFGRVGLQGQQSPTFYGIFMVFSCIKLFVISISTFAAQMQGLTCKGSSLLSLSIISSICPGCYMACQTACRSYLKSLTSWGLARTAVPPSPLPEFSYLHCFSFY